MTIGTSLFLLSSWQRVIPSVSGSITSSMTRSSEPTDRKLFSAASPFPTPSTVIPSRSSAIFRMSLTARSSSTISILGIQVRLWQLNLYCSADPFSRTDGDAASHPFGQLFADRQPQAEAFRASLSPVEALENVRQVDRAYPHSFILDRGGAVPDPQPYISTPAGMLYSVAKQNQEHLLEPLDIRQYAATFALNVEPKPDALYERLC